MVVVVHPLVLATLVAALAAALIFRTCAGEAPWTAAAYFICGLAPVRKSRLPHVLALLMVPTRTLSLFLSQCGDLRRLLSSCTLPWLQLRDPLGHRRPWLRPPSACRCVQQQWSFFRRDAHLVFTHGFNQGGASIGSYPYGLPMVRVNHDLGDVINMREVGGAFLRAACLSNTRLSSALGNRWRHMAPCQHRPRGVPREGAEGTVGSQGPWTAVDLGGQC